MSTVVKKIVIPSNRHINIELPPEVPVGEAIVTLTIEPKTPVNRLGELFGQGKGEIWMADDFDAPLEDFKEYME
ncbi:MAG: DUF2281 domain-containing protein [Planctomycetes bacterium]|nr:DUF2281 domain-containing protein [Planctomycetota bacterium]